MRGKKMPFAEKRSIFIFLSVIFAVFFLYVFFFVDVERNFFPFSSLATFLLASFLLVFSVVVSIFKKIRIGVLVGLFVVCNFILRYFGFSEIIYFFILLLIFLLIELFFKSRRDRRGRLGDGKRLRKKA